MGASDLYPGGRLYQEDILPCKKHREEEVDGKSLSRYGNFKLSPVIVLNLSNVAKHMTLKDNT